MPPARPTLQVIENRFASILRWTVTAVADASGHFRRLTDARDGMTAHVRALKDHEKALATVASRRQAGQ